MFRSLNGNLTAVGMAVLGLLGVTSLQAVVMTSATGHLSNRYQEEGRFYQQDEKQSEKTLPTAGAVTQQPTVAMINDQNNTQPKVSSTVYVLKHQPKNTLGGSAAQDTELKSYLGKGY